MRQDTLDEINKFIEDHNLHDIKREMYDLCLDVHSSGWVDGSNGDWGDECYDSEDADEEDIAEIWDACIADGLIDEKWQHVPPYEGVSLVHEQEEDNLNE